MNAGRIGVTLALSVAAGCSGYRSVAPDASNDGNADGADVRADSSFDADADADAAMDSGTDVVRDAGCPDGTTTCVPGACTDTRTDPRNCGTCGHDCTVLPGVVAAAVNCSA